MAYELPGTRRETEVRIAYHERIQQTSRSVDRQQRSARVIQRLREELKRFPTTDARGERCE